MIKTVYDNYQDIMRAILDLHVKDETFDIDPTYSSGKFYKGLQQPRKKFDLYPQTSDTVMSSSDSLPLDSDSVSSICFDPPFLAWHTKEDPTGIIGKRFHGFRYMQDVWDYYDRSLREFHRIVKKKGFVAFKCQDTVSSGKQWWSHVHIMQEAEKIGFVTKDIFINVAKNRMIGHNHANQKHARKFHSYWIVLQKI